MGTAVTCATATAMSCLVLAGSAPSANTFWLNAWKASWVSGASRLRVSDRSREGRGYNGSDTAIVLLRAVRPIRLHPVHAKMEAMSYPTDQGRSQPAWLVNAWNPV